MNKVEYFMKKYSPTILAVVGSAGVVATTVLAVKATPKALELLDDAKKDKGGDLTVLETIKATWKTYIPAVVTGVTTIVCIMSSNHLSVKQQACLASAYAVLDSSYKEYQNKVKELYKDEDVDRNVKQEIIKAKYDDRFDPSDGELLFFDYAGVRYFKSTIENVMNAENKFLESFEARGYACLNEYYDLLGIPRVDYGYQLGWFSVEENDPYNCHGLEFNYETVMIDDNTECRIITTNIPPSADYII